MKLRQVGIVVVVVWVVALLFMFVHLRSGSGAGKSLSAASVEKQLQEAQYQLKTLKSQNYQLMTAVKEMKNIKCSIASSQGKPLNLTDSGADTHLTAATADDLVYGPTKDHEVSRRRVGRGVEELWFYVRSQGQKALQYFDGNPEAAKKYVEDLLKHGQGQKSTVMVELERLAASSGTAEWRSREFDELNALMQNRISFLQNPKDCNNAKKLVCNINKGCGYGCQLHHVVYCFMVAYGLQRTLILKSEGWRYSPQGWDAVFRPVSDTCTDYDKADVQPWNNMEQLYAKQVISLPIVDALQPRPPYMPLSVPQDLIDRILRVHGDPPLWFVSHFIKYLLRPQPILEKLMKEEREKLGFRGPIVGVHVRRTDKINTEARFHAIEEYMAHVEEYFDQVAIAQKFDKRRVYLATDDKNLLPEAKKKYPDYEFLSDNSISQSAGLGTRYSFDSLKGVILDIHFLSQTDFLVCTFSSQVCRVAYEIMQTRLPDAASRFRSLDDIYYFGGQNAHEVKAVYDHKSSHAQEIDMQRGDLIGIAGNHWDGFSKGRNRRTGRDGLFPSFKVKDWYRIVDYPDYKEADKQREERLKRAGR